MFKIEQDGEQYELYVYNELSESAKNAVDLSLWVNEAEYWQKKLPKEFYTDLYIYKGIIKNTEDVFSELMHSYYGLTPYFDYIDKGKVIWATCSFKTEDIFNLLDYKSKKYLKEKYNIEDTTGVTVDIHYVPKSTHPIIELTNMELKIPNEREFIEEYMSIVEKEAPEKLDKINDALVLDIQKFIDDRTNEELRDRFKFKKAANSLSHYILLNGQYSYNRGVERTWPEVFLFDVSGKFIMVHTRWCKEL